MSSILLRPTIGLAVLLTVSIVDAVVAHLNRSGPSAEPGPSAPEGMGVQPIPASLPENTDNPVASGPQFTNRARLVLDGHFAQRIGLLGALKEMAWPGKTVLHTPDEHLAIAFVNVLARHRQLQQISRGRPRCEAT